MLVLAHDYQTMFNRISYFCMRFAWLMFAPLCLAFAALPQARADSDARAWNELMLRRGYSTNRVAAVHVAERFGEDDPRLHIALHNAGVSLSWLNKQLALAESYFKRDIVLMEKIGPNFPSIVSDCYELANIYEQEGRYKEAEALLLRGLSIRNSWKDLHSDDPYNAELYCSLHIAYYVQGETGKANDAQAQMFKAVDIWHTDKNRNLCLFKVGNDLYKFVTRSKGLTPQQSKHLLEMSRGFTQGCVSLDLKTGNEFDRSLALQYLSDIEKALGALSDAESHSREALNLAQAKFKDEHMHYAAFCALAQLSHILVEQHRYKEMDKLVDQYLDNSAKAFGAASQECVTDINNCAEIYGNESLPEQADKRRKKAAAIIQKFWKH
jgi:tetratricopeptide (TPR) repeat protein